MLKICLIKCCRRYSSVKLSATIFQNEIRTDMIDRSLLITHGLLGSKQNWNSIAKNLATKFKKVVIIDLRNHGDSPHDENISIEAMSEDIERYISSNKYVNPVLLGHSLGGKVAMHLALLKPQLLSSLVVVDVAPTATDQIGKYKVYIEAMIKSNIDQNISLPSNRKKIDVYLTSCIRDAAVRSFLLTNLVKDETTSLIRWRANLAALNKGIGQLVPFSTPAGGVFKGPTLFIAGGRSDYIRKEHWTRISELFPAATLEVIPDAGHWVHADKPHDFINILTEFGRRTVPIGGS